MPRSREEYFKRNTSTLHFYSKIISFLGEGGGHETYNCTSSYLHTKFVKIDLVVLEKKMWPKDMDVYEFSPNKFECVKMTLIILFCILLNISRNVQTSDLILYVQWKLFKNVQFLFILTTNRIASTFQKFPFNLKVHVVISQKLLKHSNLFLNTYYQ